MTDETGLGTVPPTESLEPVATNLEPQVPESVLGAPTNLTNDLTNNPVAMSNENIRPTPGRALFEKWWVWLIICAVLVGMAVGGWYWSKGKQVVIVTSRSGDAADFDSSVAYNAPTLAGWETYSYPTDGSKLTFNYAPNWRIESTGDALDEQHFFATTNPTNSLGYSLVLARDTKTTIKADLELTRVMVASTPVAASPAAGESMMPSSTPAPAPSSSDTVKIDNVSYPVIYSLSENTDRQLGNWSLTRKSGNIQIALTMESLNQAGYLTTADLQSLTSAFKQLFASIKLK